MATVHDEQQGPSKKLKCDPVPAPEALPPKAPGRFKVVSKVIMAMKRFQASLNPTYEYGKRRSDPGADEQVGPNHVHVQPKQPGASGRTSGRTTSGRTSSGRPLSAGHGNKGSLLFRPLPALEQKVESS